MFMQRLIDRNPDLLRAAIDFHQSGRIPANTFLIDLDAIGANARVLSATAEELGLKTYIMTKQFARNPFVSRVARAAGLGGVVAVDINCALMARRYGIPVGHMGHLNQIPRNQIPAAVAMRPEVMTVYNIEHAQWIDGAASGAGIIQDVMIRVSSPGDIFFDGQEGGFQEGEVAQVAGAIGKLTNVRLVGVTAFPCVRYNPNRGDKAEPTPNLHTILRAADTLRGMGIDVQQINTPGNTASDTMPMLAGYGATHVEPGNGISGTTPNHAYRDDLPEIPAYVYVTEISHHVGARAYAYGGGVYHDMHMPGSPGALVGPTWEAARENGVEYRHEIKQVIDYHAVLEPGDRCRPGDTVLLGYRTQMQMTRSFIACVSGLSKGVPQLHTLFDWACTPLDANLEPLSPASVREELSQVAAE
ncbi:alanine racemase [Mesorhizobium sp. 8]|uniref:alanine racemase n=1 Tax=Mesorhizobium sp. 8 TaxID=2584466 RepID=UPI0011240080|nr:alanine racemase [Mesorhizobium sp. 8]QDC02792.1 YhfX family PLP-dependent enzyme [Mesorhizobium sp. 8]